METSLITQSHWYCHLCFQLSLEHN